MALKVNQDLSIRNIDTDVFILNRKTSEILSFNKTGTFIWEQIRQGKERDVVIQKLIDRFDVSREDAERDFNGFVDGLKSRELLSECN